MSDVPDNTPHSDPLAATVVAARAAARKAAKAAWNVEPPFPIASDPGLWSKALNAAQHTETMLDAALAQAQHGVPIFPVSPDGDKKPLNGHGIYSSTTDPTEVNRLWKRHPNALIGVPMGRRTGVFAIDADASPPHAHDGVGAWRALEAKHGVSATRVHKTPSGGLHLLYRWQPGRPIGCPIKGLPQGVECKGEGGAVIFPPSARGGSHYRIIAEVEPTDPPGWLLDMVAPIRRTKPEARPVFRKPCPNGDDSPYGLRALDNACEALANAGPGERDRAVGEHVLAVGSLAAGGELDERRALDALTEAGRSNAAADANYCDKIERAFTTGMESPRAAPNARPTSRRAAMRAAEGRSKAADADATAPDEQTRSPSLDGAATQGKAANFFRELLDRAKRLQKFDDDGARAIIIDALERDLTASNVALLSEAMRQAPGMSAKYVKALWAELTSQRNAKASPSKEEIAAEYEIAARAERVRAEMETAERERLKRTCRDIAESPTLLADMEALVHDLGVVGESSAIRGTYLTLSSRLCMEGAIRMLRRGTASAGKNYVIEQTLKLFPDGACVRASSASPKALAYFGGEAGVGALKHKAVYVHEAAAIASKHEVENEFAVMLRTLISEGRLVHQTVSREGGVGPLSTKTVTKEGPIAVIISSARDNIEPELMTRLMASDADESFAQTEAVMRAALSGGRRLVDEVLLSSWRDYQMWLELDAPYNVEIPFRPAILAAYRERLKALPLRHRRDIHGFLTAIESSAILYRARRPRDANGRIVATIDDYRHAHEAFDRGVAALSSIAVPDTLAAVVKAVESIGAAAEAVREGDGTSLAGVKVSWQAMADKLGIARNTAGTRLSEAVEKGILRLIIPPSGYGRTDARWYEVVKSSDELKGAAEARIKTVFPSPDEVRREIEKKLATSAEREAGQASCASLDPSQHTSARNNPKPLSDAAPFRRDVKPKDAP